MGQRSLGAGPSGLRVPPSGGRCPTDLPALMGTVYICAVLSKEPHGPWMAQLFRGRGQQESSKVSDLARTLTGMGIQPGLPCPSAARPLTASPRPPPLPSACLPQPVSLSAGAYVRTGLPTVLLVCLCLLQAFGYRLRRVIAAFYFPKVHPDLSPDLSPRPPRQRSHTPAARSSRTLSLSLSLTLFSRAQREKKRVLFFYNELLRKRAAFTKLRRAAIVRQAREQRARVSQARPARRGSRLGPSVRPAPTRPQAPGP